MIPPGTRTKQTNFGLTKSEKKKKKWQVRAYTRTHVHTYTAIYDGKTNGPLYIGTSLCTTYAPRVVMNTQQTETVRSSYEGELTIAIQYGAVRYNSTQSVS